MLCVLYGKNNQTARRFTHQLALLLSIQVYLISDGWPRKIAIFEEFHKKF